MRDFLEKFLKLLVTGIFNLIKLIGYTGSGLAFLYLIYQFWLWNHTIFIIILTIIGFFVVRVLWQMQMKRRRATPYVRLLEEGEDPLQREHAIRKIADIAPGFFTPEIILALDDNDPRVRRAAAEVLGEVNRTDAALIKHLDDRDASVREAIVKSLAKIGDTPALPKLSQLARFDDNGFVRKAATEAIGIIGKNAVNYLTPQPYASIEGPSNIPEVRQLYQTYVIPGLIAALSDKDSKVREAAILALQHIDTPEAKAALTNFSDVPISDNVQFTAYYPTKVVVESQYSLYVYAHLQSKKLVIQTDVERFRKQLDGGGILNARTATKSAQLKPDSPITVIVESDEIAFDPVQLTKRWNRNWVRFDYHFSVPSSLIGDTLFIRISIQVGGIEISHIKCSIDVLEQPIEYQVMLNELNLANPLARAKFDGSTAQIYQKIFVSYSRKDEEVVEAYRLAQLALGNDVFKDTYSIKPGEDWRASLARAIDQADIFQLFWSENSAISPNVHDEWDYALKYKCPETSCVEFIRPVFWIKPMPVKPPNELAHLNFRYVPLKSLQTKKSLKSRN